MVKTAAVFLYPVIRTNCTDGAHSSYLLLIKAVEPAY